MDLYQKVTLITGASQGIGEAIAYELSKCGAEVVLIDIQEEKLKEVVDKIKRNNGKASSYVADVSDVPFADTG